MVVQHNMSAANTAGSLKIIVNNQTKATEKLSSGYKINRAGDDAAGLTISEKMRSQIRGLNKASNNAEDGISLLQVADGALGEVQSLIQRARELSVQAANDTNTDSDRAAIQSEIDAIVQEVNRVANDTEFNTMKLLDGSLGASPYIKSSNGMARMVGQTYTDAMERFVSGIEVSPIVSGGGVSSTQAAKLNDVLCNSIVPRAVNKLLSTFSVFNTAAANGQISNQIGLKIYNNSSSSELASVSIRYGYNSSTMEFADSMISLNLAVNTATLNLDASGNMSTLSRRSLETTIMHEMMHAFMDDVVTNGMIGGTSGKLDKSNQFPGWFKEGMAQTVAGGCADVNDWVNAGLGITQSSSASQITNAVKSSANSLTSGTTSSKYGTGYLACMYLGYMAAGKPASLSAGVLAGGLNTILTDLTNGSSLNDVIKDISGGAYTSMADFERKFGDAASVSFISDLVTTVGSGNGSVVDSLTEFDQLLDTPDTSNSYKVDPTQEFVTSSVGANRNWNTGGGRLNGSGAGSAGGSTAGGAGGTGGGGANGFVLQVGSLEGQTIGLSIDDMHAATLGIDGLSVISNFDAGVSITACDAALDSVSESRSKIGAYVNRLEHTIKNLDNSSENTQAAESRIRDTDMADTMVEYSKNSILTQAAQAMLSHANNNSDMVLKLLG